MQNINILLFIIVLILLILLTFITTNILNKQKYGGTNKQRRIYGDVNKQKYGGTNKQKYGGTNLKLMIIELEKSIDTSLVRSQIQDFITLYGSDPNNPDDTEILASRYLETYPPPSKIDNKKIVSSLPQMDKSSSVQALIKKFQNNNSGISSGISTTVSTTVPTKIHTKVSFDVPTKIYTSVSTGAPPTIVPTNGKVSSVQLFRITSPWPQIAPNIHLYDHTVSSLAIRDLSQIIGERYKLQVIRGDGNCYYRAFIYGLFSQSEMFDNIANFRHLTIDKLLNIIDYWGEYLDEFPELRPQIENQLTHPQIKMNLLREELVRLKNNYPTDYETLNDLFNRAKQNYSFDLSIIFLIRVIMAKELLTIAKTDDARIPLILISMLAESEGRIATKKENDQKSGVKSADTIETFIGSIFLSISENPEFTEQEKNYKIFNAYTYYKLLYMTTDFDWITQLNIFPKFFKVNEKLYNYQNQHIVLLNDSTLTTYDQHRYPVTVTVLRTGNHYECLLHSRLWERYHWDDTTMYDYSTTLQRRPNWIFDSISADSSSADSSSADSNPSSSSSSSSSSNPSSSSSSSNPSSSSNSSSSSKSSSSSSSSSLIPSSSSSSSSSNHSIVTTLSAQQLAEIKARKARRL